MRIIKSALATLAVAGALAGGGAALASAASTGSTTTTPAPAATTPRRPGHERQLVDHGADADHKGACPNM